MPDEPAKIDPEELANLRQSIAEDLIKRISSGIAGEEAGPAPGPAVALMMMEDWNCTGPKFTCGEYQCTGTVGCSGEFSCTGKFAGIQAPSRFDEGLHR